MRSARQSSRVVFPAPETPSECREGAWPDPAVDVVQDSPGLALDLDVVAHIVPVEDAGRSLNALVGGIWDRDRAVFSVRAMGPDVDASESLLPFMTGPEYPRRNTRISPLDFLAEMYSAATRYTMWKKMAKPISMPTLRHLMARVVLVCQTDIPRRR